jgi:hypothetical protein
MDLGQAHAQLSRAVQDRLTVHGFAFGQPERLAHMFDSDDEDDVEELAEQLVDGGDAAEEAGDLVPILISVQELAQLGAAQWKRPRLMRNPVERGDAYLLTAPAQAVKGSAAVFRTDQIAVSGLKREPLWYARRACRMSEAECNVDPGAARAACEESEGSRWASAWGDCLVRIMASVANSLGPAELALVAGKRHPHNLRARQRITLKISAFMRPAYDLEWCSLARMLREFIEMGVLEPCGRPVAFEVRKAAILVEHLGGWTTEGTTDLLLMGAVETLAAELSTGAPEKTQTPDVTISMNIALEPYVTEESAPVYLSWQAGVRLLKLVAALRGVDTTGLAWSGVSFHDRSVQGYLERSKLTGLGRKVTRVPVFAARVLHFSGTVWGSAWEALRKPSDFRCDRDRLVMLPKIDISGTQRVRAEYEVAGALAQPVLSKLKKPALDLGSNKFVSSDEPWSVHSTLHSFWRKLSERRFVNSKVAEAGVGEDRRNCLGRGFPKECEACLDGFPCDEELRTGNGARGPGLTDDVIICAGHIDAGSTGAYHSDAGSTEIGGLVGDTSPPRTSGVDGGGLTGPSVSPQGLSGPGGLNLQTQTAPEGGGEGCEFRGDYDASILRPEVVESDWLAETPTSPRREARSRSPKSFDWEAADALWARTNPDRGGAYAGWQHASTYSCAEGRAHGTTVERVEVRWAEKAATQKEPAAANLRTKSPEEGLTRDSDEARERQRANWKEAAARRARANPGKEAYASSSNSSATQQTDNVPALGRGYVASYTPSLTLAAAKCAQCRRQFPQRPIEELCPVCRAWCCSLVCARKHAGLHASRFRRTVAIEFAALYLGHAGK